MKRLFVGAVGAIALALSVAAPVKAEEISVSESMRSFANQVLGLCQLHYLNFKSAAEYDYDKATYVCRDFSMNYDAAIRNIAEAETSENTRDFLLALKHFDDLYAPVTITITNTPSGFTRSIERDLMKYE